MKSTKRPYELLTHQQASVKKLSKAPRFFDISDAGTGKTLVEIHY